ALSSLATPPVGYPFGGYRDSQPRYQPWQTQPLLAESRPHMYSAPKRYPYTFWYHMGRSLRQLTGAT
ncbi:MAG: hypothetical protein ACPGTU_17055, partial [Myxococcota bacterium]